MLRLSLYFVMAILLRCLPVLLFSTSHCREAVPPLQACARPLLLDASMLVHHRRGGGTPSGNYPMPLRRIAGVNADDPLLLNLHPSAEFTQFLCFGHGSLTLAINARRPASFPSSGR